MPEQVTLRWEVQELAFAIERRLRANEKKGKEGWEHMSVQECLSRASDERKELDEELAKKDPSLKAVRHEIEDNVNFLLFAWHNAQDEFWGND